LGLSLSFLLGLLVLLLHGEFDDALPRPLALSALLVQSPILGLPYLIARIVARRIGRAVMRGGVPGRRLRLTLRLQPVVVPMVYALLLGGELPVAASELAPASYWLQVVILIGPLLAMEVSMRLAERRTVRWLQIAGLSQPSQLGVERVPMTLFVAMPVLVFAVAADVLALQRNWEVFFAGTSLGSILALLLVLLALCVALPLAFRWVLPVSPSLPLPVEGGLRETARRLGFPPTAVMSMHTRHRMINAALIGPLPWPRYLVLTDGLLSLLDLHALRGVVAHEIGHARANHPRLLVLIFVGLPMLLFYPAKLAGLFALDSIALLVVLVVVAPSIWLLLRGLAHRFEYEADQMSAEALGGADHCVQALRRVGELTPNAAHRSTFRHPSESNRIRNLFLCEQSTEHRRRFWRRGRALRISLYTALTVALGLFVWSQFRLFPVDRAVYLYYTGKFVEARDQLDHLVAGGYQSELIDELRPEVDATLRLGFRDADWNSVRDELSAKALALAERELLDGASIEKVEPLLAVATYRLDCEPWLRSAYLYSRAVLDEDRDQTARLRKHLLSLDLPPRWAPILAALGVR